MTAHIINRSRLNDDTMIIEVGRLLDNENADVLSSMLTEIRSSGYCRVIIDMKSLDFISSAGVGSILGSVEMFREAKGDIILCNARENIIHVFEILDIKDYLTIRQTDAEARQLCQTKS